MKPDPNHPILCDINKWIGENVEVSNTADETDWHRATLVGYDSPHFAVKLSKDGRWSDWKFCRPPESKRRTPTDEDAAQWPRTTCWVRDCDREQWSERKLLAVVKGGFVTTGTQGNSVFWRYCEIEDKP